MNTNKIIGDKVCPLLLIARNLCITIANATNFESRPPAICLKTDCAMWDTRNHQCAMRPDPNPLVMMAPAASKPELPQ